MSLREREREREREAFAVVPKVDVIIPNQDNHLQVALVENAKFLDKVLLAFVGTAAMVFFLRCLGLETFEWNKVTLSLSEAWIVFSLLTIAHGYTAWLFLESCFRLRKQEIPTQGKVVFEKLVSRDGGLFMRNLRPRHKIRAHNYYVMNLKDPTTLLSYACAALLFFATIPFQVHSHQELLSLALVGAFLTYVNWKIGSTWAAAASELSVHDSSFYDQNLPSLIALQKLPTSGIEGLIWIMFYGWVLILTPFYVIVAVVVGLLNGFSFFSIVSFLVCSGVGIVSLVFIWKRLYRLIDLLGGYGGFTAKALRFVANATELLAPVYIIAAFLVGRHLGYSYLTIAVFLILHPIIVFLFQKTWQASNDLLWALRSCREIRARRASRSR